MAVRIFTDSACDLEFSELEALQVELLRIPVFFDEERYIEGENLTREEFYEKLAVSERLPKTAQITPVEFEEAFRPYVEAGEEIVVLPLAKPVLAILCLYYGLAHWNDYFTGLIYINTRSLQPLQLFLREILIQNAQLEMGSGDMMALEDSMRRVYMMQVMRYGLIVVSSVPMLILYPFVQKYFNQGVMIGALKG